MALSKSSITEDLLVWLETDDAVKQDPEALVLKRNLLDKLAAKKRQLSAVSKSSGYMLSNVDGGCKLISFESSRDRTSTLCAKNSFGASTLRYKTELCRSFGESGYCRYGEKCQFAHGIAELRQTPRHPRYKTELCKAYHLNGFCPYGARCNFIHNDIDPIELNEVKKPSKQSASSVSGPVTGDAVSTSGQSENGSHVTELSWPATKHALGSTADSPPQSVTDSPSPSPTAMLFDPAFDTFPIIWSAVVQPRMT